MSVSLHNRSHCRTHPSTHSASFLRPQVRVCLFIASRKDIVLAWIHSHCIIPTRSRPSGGRPIHVTNQISIVCHKQVMANTGRRSCGLVSFISIIADSSSWRSSDMDDALPYLARAATWADGRLPRHSFQNSQKRERLARGGPGNWRSRR